MSSLSVRTRLGPYREQWDALVLEHYPPCAQLRSWWLEGIADASSRFLLVVDGDRLLGGLAVDVTRVAGSRVTAVRLPGGLTLGPLHADLLAVPGHEEAVVAWTREWFRTHRDCVVDLNGVRQRPLVASALPVEAQVRHRAEAPVVKLPKRFDEYLQERSRNWRVDLKRSRKRLEKEGLGHRVLRADELDAGIESLRRLHRQRHGQDSEFLPEFGRFASAAHSGVDNGELVFHVIARGNDIIAVDVVFRVGDHADDFQAGRDTTDSRYRGAGTLLVGKIVEWACEQGLRELDLETAADEYKLRMTEEVRPVQRLVASWGPQARWYARATSARRVAAVLAERGGAVAARRLRSARATATGQVRSAPATASGQVPARLSRTGTGGP